MVFIIPFTKKSYRLLPLFKKVCFISNFSLIKIKEKLFIRIYPFYFKDLKNYYHFKMFSTPTKTFYISYKSLLLLSYRSASSVYLISTSKGVLTHHEAIKKHLSGFIVGYFFS